VVEGVIIKFSYEFECFLMVVEIVELFEISEVDVLEVFEGSVV